MSRFEIFSVVAFVVIFISLAFLFNSVRSPSAPCLGEVGGRIGELEVVDQETYFENEYIFVADGPEGITYQDYLNNLMYYKEELYKTFKSSPEVVSFLYYDIATGYTFSYNEEVEIPASSAIKTNLAIFIMDLVSQEKADLSKKLTYTENDYNPGSGIIKNHVFGTQYSIEQLLELMIIDSDNIAYLLLLNEFGSKNSREYWLNHGATTTYKSGGSWGSINAKDGLTYMKRLYSFYREDKHYGTKLMDLFRRARFRFLFSSTKNTEIAHKSGCASASVNDLSIVFDEQPFIFVVLTRKDAFNTSYMPFFSKISDQIYSFHEYYWDNISYRYIK